MKKYLVVIISLICYFFVVRNVEAQDYHFSQFSTAPLYTSPALTGFMSGRHRIAIKHRNQWSSILQDNSYKTILISYDGRICPIGKVSIAYGLNMVKDEVGFPSFKTNHFLASFAAHLKLDKELYASGGIQFGLLQYCLDLMNLKFENQYDGFVGFNISLPSLENFSDKPVNQFDIGGGVLLYNKKRAWNIGIAFHHINTDNFYTFTNSELQENNRTRVRWVVHGSVPFKLNRRTLVAFKKMTVIQFPHWQTNIGGDLRYNISSKRGNPFLNGIIIGAGTRISNRINDFLVTDALVFSGKTDIAKGILLGVGFDLNVSPLKKSSNRRGGFELSLVWEFSKSDNDKCVECPSINQGTYGKGLWQLWN